MSNCRKQDSLKSQLEENFPELDISDSKAWSELTTLGIGNCAPLVVSPPDDIILADLLRYCDENNIPILTLGGGSNIVGSDSALPGIVITLNHNNFGRIRPGRRHLTVGAGVRLITLIRSASALGFGGLSGLAGIPGSVGGAVRMNAGANGVCVAEFVSDMCGYRHDGSPWAARGTEIAWSYRGNDIPDDVIITTVIFRIKNCDPVAEDQLIEEHLAERAVNFGGRNAGCAFRNVCSEMPSGRLIEHAGCKGWVEGDAQVSEVHANYIINTGAATERNYMRLMTRIRRLIYGEFSVYLQPEVVFANPDSREDLDNDPVAPLVAVLKGGNCSEREVSLESGGAVAMALRNAGYRVDEIDIQKLEITNAMRRADIVFPVLHGGFGENGGIQALMEENNLNFVGSGSVASKLIIDKIASKKLMQEHAIPTAPWAVITPGNRDFPENLTLPVVVKPPCEGSTFGITLVETMSEWDASLDKAFEYDGIKLMVENYISGSETTVGIINGRTLPMIEIQIPGKMYDYDAKYTHTLGETRYLCPPETISEELQKTAAEIALKFYNVSGARDILRVDIIIADDGSMHVLEGNSIPGFTASSLVPKAAGADNICFEALCAWLVNNAMLGH
jgi:UDP-N-acetylenolpyruvoylglucosamine reductase